jgi:hypothetical protein
MAAADKPHTYRSTVEQYSFNRAAAVTPNDGADLTNVTRGIYVGGSGDLSVVTPDGDSVTFKAVPVGTFAAIRVARVMATGTTATNLVALW